MEKKERKGKKKRLSSKWGHETVKERERDRENIIIKFVKIKNQDISHQKMQSIPQAFNNRRELDEKKI